MMNQGNESSRPPRALASSHMPSLDSLRGVAILMVVVFHGYSQFNWSSLAGGRFLGALVAQGPYGVHLFFLLSGFLIGTALLRARGKKNYYKNFYIKRFLRIMPAYFLLIFVLKIWLPVSWNFVLAGSLFMANYARLFGAHNYEYGSLWSLAVEEHFYLLWPTCVRRLSQKVLYSVLVSIIVLEPVARLAVVHISKSIDVTYKTTFVLDNIAYGALLAVLIHSGRITTENAKRYGLTLVAISAPLVLLTMYFANDVNVRVLRSVPWVWLCAGVLLLGLARDARRSKSSAAHRPRGILPFFGYISYGLYLVHVFINDKLGPLFDRLVVPGTQGSFQVYTARAVICTSAAITVAYLSRRYFEAPMLVLKDKLTGHRELEAEEKTVPAAQVLSVP